MRALVSGGAGFIGSHLVDLLLSKGIMVTVADDLSTGDVRNLASAMPSIRFVQGDLLDEDVRLEATFGADIAFHLASFVSVPKSIDDPAQAHLRGSHLTALMLESCRLAGVGRFVFASSCSIYQPPKDDVDAMTPRNEAMLPAPSTPYAASKAAGEHMVRAYASCYPMDGVSLRFFNVYGPRQGASSAYSGVVARFCTAAANGGEIDIHGDGLQARDFIYVSDVAQACLLAATIWYRLGGAAMNVGTGVATSVLDVADAVGQSLPRKFTPARDGDIRSIVSDTWGIKALGGFCPKVSLQEGIDRTVEWYKETAN